LLLQPLIVVCFTFVLTQLAPFKLLELSYEDLLVTHSKTIDRPSDDIVVLTITENTLVDFPYRSPVDRAYLASIIDMLRRSEVKSIGIDILFDQATEPAKDAALRKAFDSVAEKLVIASATSIEGLNDQQISFQSKFLEGLNKATVLLAKSDQDGIVRHAYSSNLFDRVLAQNLAHAMTSHVGGIRPDPLERIFYQSDKEGAPHKFKVYPAESVSILPEEWFKGKYVLIGSNLPGIDQFRTPFASRFGEAAGTMPGVMIHANILNQILSNVQVVEVSNLGVILALAAAAVLGTVLVFLATSIIVTMLPILLAVIAILVIPYWGFPKLHTVVPAVSIATSFILAVFLGTYLRWREDRKQQRIIKNAWTRSVSPAVVAELLSNPGMLDTSGERRDISLIFTDLENSTSLAETLPLERLTPVLNTYMDRLSSEFLDAGATIGRFTGDGIMGYFGAPIHDVDHAGKAVTLALRLDRICREFQEELLREEITFGRTRIGVHSGIAIVGNFGGSRFFDYMAMGNTVNTAARLESANKLFGSSICVSGDTARRAVLHSFRPIGHLRLVGKLNLVDAWEPFSEGLSDFAPLADYELAYRKLENESQDSQQAFDKLNKRYPNDHLVSFHLDRLNNNGRGTLFETSK